MLLSGMEAPEGRLTIRCGQCAADERVHMKAPMLAYIPENSEGDTGGTMFLRPRRVGANQALRAARTGNIATLRHARGLMKDERLARALERDLATMKVTGRAPARNLPEPIEVHDSVVSFECSRCRRRFPRLSVKRFLRLQSAGYRTAYATSQGIRTSV
jgi:hypothetical protein